MDMIFDGYEAITITENHIKQLHGVLLKYSTKDQDHRGEYKKVTNHVEAFGPDGKSIGVVFETATPFETPGWMREIVDWFNRSIEEESQNTTRLISLIVLQRT
jgi:Fic family protein